VACASLSQSTRLTSRLEAPDSSTNPGLCGATPGGFDSISHVTEEPGQDASLHSSQPEPAAASSMREPGGTQRERPCSSPPSESPRAREHERILPNRRKNRRACWRRFHGPSAA